MINQKDIYVGLNLPSNNELLWARPQSNGSVVLSVKVNNGWVAANSESGGGLYYSKQEIDDRFADVLGIDAEGIAALKALVEDGSAMTGLLTAINNKYDKVNGIQLTSKSGDVAPVPFIKVNYGDGIEGSVELSSGLLKFNGGTGEGSYSLHASFTSVIDQETGKTNPAGIHYPKSGDDMFDNTTIARICDVEQMTDEKQNLLTAGSNISIVSDVISAVDTTYDVLPEQLYGEDESLITTGDKYDYKYSSEQFKNYSTNDYKSNFSSWYGTKTISIIHDGFFTFTGWVYRSGSSPLAAGSVSIILTHDNEDTTIFNASVEYLQTLTVNKTFKVYNGDTLKITNEIEAGTNSVTVAQNYYISSREQLSDYIKKQLTAGLVKNDGTIDLTEYLTQHLSIKTVNNSSLTGSGNVSVGTVTGITMNSASKTVDGNGVVDLGTVLTQTTDLIKNTGYGSDFPVVSSAIYQAVSGLEKKLSFTTSTSTSYTATKNTYYAHTNNPTTLSIKLPSSSLTAGDQCGFSFITGSSITTPTVTGGTVKKMDGWASMWSSNKAYEIIALYDGAKWLVTATKFE